MDSRTLILLWTLVTVCLNSSPVLSGSSNGKFVIKVNKLITYRVLQFTN